MIIGKNIETLLSALRDAFNRLVNGKQVVGYEAIDLSGAVVKTLTVPAGATEAIISLESSQASVISTSAKIGGRYTLDGTTPQDGGAGPAVNAGMPIAEYETIVVKGAGALTAFKIFPTAVAQANKAALKVTYFK